MTFTRSADANSRDPRLNGPVEKAAWAFYAVAALGSSIGQIWAGVEVPPWPQATSPWLRTLLVLPFAVVLDLGGVVCAAFADSRQRLGENAYSWRILSAGSVTVAVSINIIGHAEIPYLAAVFGGLGLFAYTVWLLHSSARRRDALRAAGKLAATPPSYGLAQWCREPTTTLRARDLARHSGHGLQQSLDEARTQLRTEARRMALGRRIETMIRLRHAEDPVLAAIAATTADIDAVADGLMTLIDSDGWARAIAAEIQPPPDIGQPVAVVPALSPCNHYDALDGRDEHAADGNSSDLELDASVLRYIPSQQADYDRWREMWQAMVEDPDASNRDIARRYGVSPRTAQRVRLTGRAKLLDSPATAVARIAALATTSDEPARTPPTS